MQVTPSTTGKKPSDCSSTSTALDSVIVVTTDGGAWTLPANDADSVSVSASTTTISSQCTVIGSESLISPGNSSSHILDAGQSTILAGSPNIVSIATGSSGICRSEVRRSKSKVRSYLRKCKDALIGGSQQQHQPNGGEPITHHEAVSQCATATSSWYLDAVDDCHVDEAVMNITTPTEVDANDEDAAVAVSPADGNDKPTLTDISAVSEVNDGDAEIQPICIDNSAGLTQLDIEPTATTTASDTVVDIADFEKLTAASDSHESTEVSISYYVRSFEMIHSFDSLSDR